MLNCFLIFTLIGCVYSLNILIIVQIPRWSHQQPFLAVADKLINRGHNVTIFTAFPPKDRISNLTVIDTSDLIQYIVDFKNKNNYTLTGKSGPYETTIYLIDLIESLSDTTFSMSSVQQFIRNLENTKFDAVVLEDFYFSSYSGIVHKIGSPPVIGLRTVPNYFPFNMVLGVPSNPSYVPDGFLGYTDEMSFIERVHNTIFHWFTYYVFRYKLDAANERVLRKHFGYGPPPARDFEHNKSLVISTVDLSVTYAQPLTPNIITIGPLHLKPVSQLPKDLQEWLDGAEDGVVYYSLGSSVQGFLIRKNSQEELLKAFSKFPKLRFLWKFESKEGIPDLPNNVLVREWFPQKDILAHPKLKLMITQGGLQSTQELVSRSVPIIGIPIFADQLHNVMKIVKDGGGKLVDFDEISANSVYDAIKDIIYDNYKIYKGNMQKMTNIAKDKMVPAIDEAAWWIEYVIRHNGAKHLRVSSLKLSLVQYFLIDVYAFIIIIVLSPILIGYYLYKFFFKTRLSKYEKKKKSQ